MCPIIVQPMQTFILTLQESIFDVHHLVDFHSECLTVGNNYVCCTCIPQCKHDTYSCMHHSTIDLDSLHAACHAL